MKNDRKNRIAFGLSRMIVSARRNGSRVDTTATTGAAAGSRRQPCHALRSMLAPSQARYAAPAHFNAKNSFGKARNSEAKPAAASTIHPRSAKRRVRKEGGQT